MSNYLLASILKESLETAFPGGFNIRDEANALTACAFRNGTLEGLHTGKSSPLLDDTSLSRITDKEIKQRPFHEWFEEFLNGYQLFFRELLRLTQHARNFFSRFWASSFC